MPNTLLCPFSGEDCVSEEKTERQCTTCDTYPRATKEQPPPQESTHPAVWGLVITDMDERDATGRRRYGTPLRGHNGRDALVDAYQEALDLVVYLRQAIYERDGH